MTTSHLEQEALPFDRQFFNEQVGRLSHPTVDALDRITKKTVYFYLFFLVIGVIELSLFVTFFALFNQSTILAFSLAFFFLTLFSFFIIRLYIQAQKPELLAELCQDFLETCQKIIRFQENVPEHHLGLASACCKLAAQLHEREYSYYTPPFFLKNLSALFETMSCFLHWKDLYKMKELLLLSSIEEHIKIVKCEPTNLEVHAALANAYVLLSSLYADPRKFEGYEEERWIPQEKLSAEMQLRFRATAQRAIEEFKILNDYAPNDPWVHMQLAYSYHDLQMPEEEIREYETILKLCPEDKDTFFKLGMLYFQQGMNAQGLKIYEILKRKNYKKAESLIKFYGSYAFINH